MLQKDKRSILISAIWLGPSAQSKTSCCLKENKLRLENLWLKNSVSLKFLVSLDTGKAADLWKFSISILCRSQVLKVKSESENNKVINSHDGLGSFVQERISGGSMKAGNADFKCLALPWQATSLQISVLNLMKLS